MTTATGSLIGTIATLIQQKGLRDLMASRRGCASSATDVQFVDRR